MTAGDDKRGAVQTGGEVEVLPAESALESLPEKRRRFVEAYMGEALGNGTEAARIAGYASPGPEASRLLRNANVVAAIESLRPATVADRQERIETLTRILRGEETTEVARRVGRGDEARIELVEVPPTMTERLKALELLGKVFGDYIDRVDHTSGGERIEPVVIYLPDDGSGG